MMPVLFHLCWEFRDLLWSGRRNDLAHVREMRIPEIRSSLLALRKKGPSSHSALILPIAHWGPFIFPFWISFQLFPFSPFPVFLLYLSLKKYSFQKSKTKEKKNLSILTLSLLPSHLLYRPWRSIVHLCLDLSSSPPRVTELRVARPCIHTMTVSLIANLTVGQAPWRVFSHYLTSLATYRALCAGFLLISSYVAHPVKPGLL
jgi:hypothetical protein